MARSTPPARTLNLKNPEVYRLASELAAVTGESMTEAVRLSLEERLDRVTRRRDVEVERRIRRIQELAAEIRKRLPEGISMQEIDEQMYDENGLPRW
jgi:antitoxin VapB